jgi:hypothetical protein
MEREHATLHDRVFATNGWAIPLWKFHKLWKAGVIRSFTVAIFQTRGVKGRVL